MSNIPAESVLSLLTWGYCSRVWPSLFLKHTGPGAKGHYESLGWMVYGWFMADLQMRRLQGQLLAKWALRRESRVSLP